MLLSPPTFRNALSDHEQEEEQPEVKTKKKRRKRILTLLCEWDNCEAEQMLPPEEYQVFAAHIRHHIDDAVDRANEELSDEGEQEQGSRFQCLWRGCTWDTGTDLLEFTRHVLFHGYHSKLKCNGAIEELNCNLTSCTLDAETQNLLPDLSQPFTCLWDSCRTEFQCADKFYRHVDEHTLATEGVDVAPDDQATIQRYLSAKSKPPFKTFHCIWEGCGVTFKNVYKLKEHCRVHTKEKLVACPNCGGFFSNKTKFADHLTRQNSEAYQDFQCSHCLKRCASERLLRDHMRHHVNHLKCPHCDMTCPNPSCLKEHIMFRHKDEKPHKCSMCSYSCKSSSDLQRHEETHFPKRYQCAVPGCDFTTKTLHCLKRHHRTKHEVTIVDRFVCHICNSRYTRGTGLTHHLKSKHNFSWPSGHPRFRYRQYEDGLYRLQMVRFESAELTQQLAEDQPKPAQVIEDLSSNETLPQDEESATNAAPAPAEQYAAMVTIQDDGTVTVVQLDKADENTTPLPSVVMHTSDNLQANDGASINGDHLQESQSSSSNQLTSSQAAAYQLLLDYFEKQLQAKGIRRSPQKSKEEDASVKTNTQERDTSSVLVTEHGSTIPGNINVSDSAGSGNEVSMETQSHELGGKSPITVEMSALNALLCEAEVMQAQELRVKSPLKVDTTAHDGLSSKANPFSEQEVKISDDGAESPSKRETRSSARKMQEESAMCQDGNTVKESCSIPTPSENSAETLTTGGTTEDESVMKRKGSKKRKSRIELTNDDVGLEERVEEPERRRKRKSKNPKSRVVSRQPNEFDQILDISKTLLSLKGSSIIK